MKILIHGTIAGYGGIAHHSRKLSYFLNKKHEVKFRNFNVSEHWKGYNGKSTLDNEPLLENHKDILYTQTLYNHNNQLEDFPLSGFYPEFKPDVHLVMAEVGHHYYYQEYQGYKIAYFAHETDKIKDDFLNRLNYFDEVWVPSKWQEQILINQNFDRKKIKVVNEGVDPSDFSPINKPKEDKIKILHVGTFEYRKSSYEIIKCFIDNFRDNPNVELRLSINNKLRKQDVLSEYEKYGLEKLPNIVFLNTLTYDDYKNEINNADIYLSCARGEGWNIPLIESMACGIPCIYSKCGGQLEFANEKYHTGIDIVGTLPHDLKVEINGHTWWWYFGEHFQGNLYEPDFNQLSTKLKEVVDNIQEYKNKSLEYSKHILDTFNWEKIASDVSDILTTIPERQTVVAQNTQPLKEVYYKIHSNSFGDTLGATPTLRYLYESHNQKINVVTHNKGVFINNPYIDKLLSFFEFGDLNKSKDSVVYESFTYAGTSDKNGIEKKFAHLDIRQVHAMDLGFQLTPQRMSYDYFPDKNTLDVKLPERYVVLHITTNWANRTWNYDYWKTLIEWLRFNNIFTVLIGSGYREELHKSYSDAPLDKVCPSFDNLYGLDLTNQGTMSDMWWIINGAKCIVTMDTGPLHLAGTTDTYILQLGSAIDPYLRAPYRHGTQNYKYEYIGGTCNLHCNSNLKYYVKEWGHINAVPPLPNCMENKPRYECHPYPNQVINKINEIILN